MSRARSSLALPLVVAGAIAVFWIAAAMSDFFLDRPFVYTVPDEWSNDLVRALARFPGHSEAALQLVATVMLVPAVLCLVMVGARSRVDPLERAWARLGTSSRRFACAMSALAALAALVVAFLVLRQVFLIDDERAYSFQASRFGEGRLTLPAVPAAFRNPMMLLMPAWMGKYPPGHSLLLLPGALLGLPHLMPPLVGGTLVFCTYGFVRETFGERQAVLSAALLAASPFLWCGSGTLMAFTAAACTMLASFWFFARARQRGTWRDYAAAGTLLGMSFLVRPFDAVTMGLPMGCWLLVDAARAAWPGRFAADPSARTLPGAHETILPFGLGVALLVAVFLVYNWLTLGSPFRMGYTSAGDFAFGFYVRSLPGHPYVHTPLQGVALLPVALMRLDLWLFAWPGGLLLVLAGLFLARTPWDRFLVATVIVFGVTHMLLASTGTWDVGPTYCFPIAPLLVVQAVRGLRALRNVLAESPFGRSAIGWVPVAGACIAFSTIIPIRLLRLATLASEIEAPWKAIEQSQVGDSIVVLPGAPSMGAAGYALGYPYQVKSGTGIAHLVRPHSNAELAEARNLLGTALPVYVLALDQNAFRERGVRIYEVRPLS